YFGDIGWHAVDRRTRWEPRRRAGASLGRYVAHRHRELLSFVGEDEIDERASGGGILRRLENGHGLGDGRIAFGGKDEIDGRAFRLGVESHEIDQDAVRFLAV